MGVCTFVYIFFYYTLKNRCFLQIVNIEFLTNFDRDLWKIIMSDMYVTLLYDILSTVKAAPHECLIRTDQPYTYVKAENEACFIQK